VGSSNKTRWIFWYVRGRPNPDTTTARNTVKYSVHGCAFTYFHLAM